ncbi:MAG: hypothetical protein GY715_01655 [Planctomycetes bacterium]|nr:hypothetical protein [Planctomycetota bacterium]
MRVLTALITFGLLVTGCTRMHQTYPGHDPDLVWTALVAVAQTPDYADDPDDDEETWVVKENSVWVDAPNSRIEVYRELDRFLHRDNVKPLRQHRAWRFQIVMHRTDPPRAIFTSRGFAVPTQAAVEARRYFADVNDILEYGASSGAETSDAEEPADERVVPVVTTRPDTDFPDAPIADIDALEPE